jgi:hypothetical protein
VLVTQVLTDDHHRAELADREIGNDPHAGRLPIRIATLSPRLHSKAVQALGEGPHPFAQAGIAETLKSSDQRLAVRMAARHLVEQVRNGAAGRHVHHGRALRS